MFQWERQPKAEALIVKFLEKACEANTAIAQLQGELHKHTSTRLFDWLDHVIVRKEPEAGFVLDETGVFHHPGAQLPRIQVGDQEGIAVKVDSIADFLMVRGIEALIEGAPLSGYRRAEICKENGISLYVVERRHTLTMEPTTPKENRYLEALELWQARPRALDDEDKAMEITLTAAEKLIKLVGKDLAAWVVLEGERKYWESRNLAGQLQKNRQDRLGMGWANHDHHTFRSSRRRFPHLVRFFEMLGFHCRERFYAGEEAGWGAQVMENPNCHLVLFLDVDLDPHELKVDFAHQEIPELENLGTIGLWCALHGDSLLKAGMHHLEAQFLFEELTEDLEHRGVGMMQPFSNFPYLKQAFTAGEIWPVDPRRVQKLLQAGKITQEQADKFIHYGAVGSHLENLQRREGYKGFNQKNVSVIIKETDPRRLG